MNALDIIDNYLGASSLGDYQSILSLVKSISFESALRLNTELMTSMPKPRASSEGFNYIADSTFSGLPIPCCYHACRFTQIAQLLGFSSIYASQVVSYNPFSYASIHSTSKEDFLEELAFGITAVIAMQPLINRGIITFVEFRPLLFCESCLSSLIHGTASNATQFDARVLSNSYNSLLDTTRVELVEIESAGQYVYEISDVGSDAHTHGAILIESTLPSKFSGDTLPYKLSRDEIIELGVHDSDARFLTNDFLHKCENVQALKINHVHSSMNELLLLKKILGVEVVRDKFEISMPFVTARNANSILDLRDQEWHHFEEFRSLIFQTANRSELDGREMEDLFRGDILPKMIALEKIVRKFQKTNRDSLVDNSAVSAFSLISVVATSGISSLFGLATALLGSGHFAKSMVPALRKAMSEPDAARDSTMYYAWRLKKL